MAKERILTQAQREEYNKISNQQGKAAADAFKAKIAQKTSNDPTEPKKKKVKLSPEGKELNKDFSEGKTIAEKQGFLEESPLVDENLAKSLLDPTSPNYVGGNTKESTDFISQVGELIKNSRNPDGSLKLDPTVQESLNLAKETLDRTRTRPQDVQEGLNLIRDNAGYVREQGDKVISDLKKTYDTIDQEDARLTKTLQLMEGGLSGLDSAQNQALREQSVKELEGKRQAATRNLNDSVARNAMRGGASFAAQRQLEDLGQRNAADAEQKLLLANIDVQDSRRNDYAKAIQDSYNARTGAKNQAAANLSLGASQMLGVTTDATAANITALDQVTTNERTAQNQATANLLTGTGNAVANAQTAEGNLLQTQGDATSREAERRAKQVADAIKTVIDAQATNSDIVSNNVGSKVAATTGVVGTKIAKKNQKMTEEELKSRPRGGGGGATPPDLTPLINEIIKGGANAS